MFSIGHILMDGQIVVDDLSPDNVGLTIGNPILDFITPDFLKNLKIIDMGYQTVPEWLELGYKLKNGGKVSLLKKYSNKK